MAALYFTVSVNNALFDQTPKDVYLIFFPIFCYLQYITLAALQNFKYVSKHPFPPCVTFMLISKAVTDAYKNSGSPLSI